MTLQLQRIIFLLFFASAIPGGCSVTEEKIALWKSTRNGPQKLADVLSDTSAELNLRASATLALIEIKQHSLLNDTYRQLSKNDADTVIQATVPALSKQINAKTGAADALTSVQIAAINGAYLLYAFAGDKSKTSLENELIDWCTHGNFRARERAGFNIRVIMKKVGAPAYLALSKRLDIDEPSIEKIAAIIKDAEDQSIIGHASKQIAQSLGQHIGGITMAHLRAAGILGGQPVADFLIALVVNPNLSAQLRDYGLLVFFTAMEQQRIIASVSHATQLVAIAEDTTQAQAFREQVYLTLAQMTFPVATASFSLLLSSRDFFWRMLGARCLLRQNGKQHLPTVLQTRKIVTDTTETGELISLVAKFPSLKDTLISTLSGTHSFSVGIAISVLGIVGNRNDIPQLEKLRENRGRLPSVFSASTIGAAASAAISAIEKKG
ncbi:MAG: hypothetical protein JXX14_24575 [Deltaproteobacteria bacterium]|nr:hypothetical protein [Deltaproteobacteria bacterium]